LEQKNEKVAQLQTEKQGLISQPTTETSSAPPLESGDAEPLPMFDLVHLNLTIWLLAKDSLPLELE